MMKGISLNYPLVWTLVLNFLAWALLITMARLR